MRKLRLDVEQLAVETFEVTPAGARERGTVHGHITRGVVTCVNTDCDQNTCLDTCYSCPDTCWNTCAATCPNSCEGSCEVSCNGTCYDPTCASCAPTCGELTCDVSCEGTCPPDCTDAKYIC